MRKFILLAVCCAVFVACVNNKQSKPEISKVLEEMAEDSRPLHDDKFYEGLLEAFCQKHFDEKYGGMKIFDKGAVKYLPGSLEVTSTGHRDTNTDKVEGTIRFRYLYGFAKSPKRRFEAYVTDKGNGNDYLISFTRQGGFDDNNIKPTGEIPFVYPSRK